MIIKARTIYSKLLTLLLLFLGFTQCTNSDPMDEYGTPSATYKVIGKVVDAEAQEKGIEGIQVEMLLENEEERCVSLTNKTGEFILENKSFPNNKYRIKFLDIDGETNGSFTEKEMDIEFTKDDYKDGDSWYKGHAEKDMGTITLDAQKTVEEIEKKK